MECRHWGLKTCWVFSYFLQPALAWLALSSLLNYSESRGNFKEFRILLIFVLDELENHEKINISFLKSKQCKLHWEFL